MPPIFEIKPNIFKSPLQLALEADSIVVRRAGNETAMRYGDITSVQLTSAPSQEGIHRECRLKDRKGQTLRITALYYKGLGQVDDRTAAYGPFVRDLLQRVVASGQTVTYQANSRLLWWIYAILLALLVAVVLLLLVVTIMEPSAALKTSGPIMVLAFVGPLMWRYLRSAQSVFDPRQPPTDLLGP